MSFRVRIAIVALVAAYAAPPVHAQEPEDSLRIYAAKIVKTPPLKAPFVGFAIYLGRGAFLSAAHVVGRWPLFTRPRVLVAGMDLPATVIKMGFADDVDVTLVTVDETRLPIAMQMRRNPICKTPPIPGEKVFGAIPDKVVLTHILSPLYVQPQYRREFDTLTADIVTASGSGIFRASSKCLLGIVSRSIPRFKVHTSAGGIVEADAGEAGYFVPAAKILEFLPKEFRD
jgi:hypothetical protein